MILTSKIASLVWFARRPALWPQAVNLAVAKVRPNRDRAEDRAAATHWCADHEVDLAELRRQLGWTPAETFDSFVDSEDLHRAQQILADEALVMGGRGHVDLLIEAAENLGATEVLETGVALGWSSLALLSSVAKRAGRVVSVDMPYVKGEREHLVGVVVPPHMKQHWTLLRVADRQGIPRGLRELGGSMDLCHYDSDKSYWGRRWAYPRLWAALRAGGLFVSDDIQDNEAFREFVNALAVPFFVLEFEKRYVGVVPKPK